MPRSLNDLIASRQEDYERMVLSEILTTRRMVLDLMPEYFCGENRALYEALQEQWARFGEINPQLLGEKHARAMLRCLDDEGNASAEVVEELHKRYLSRSMGLMVHEAMQRDDPAEGLRCMQEYIAEALFSRNPQNYNHADNLSRLFRAMERGVKENLTVAGVPIGIPEYDRLTNGFERGKVYVVGALKKTGKSRWMVQAAIRAAGAGAGVLMDSLEMSAVRLNHLALSYYSGINSAKIGRLMSKSEYDALRRATDELTKLTWRIYQDHTVSDLRSRIIYERTKAPVDIVFVDFIQRMRNDKYRGDRTREVERIAQDLADLAREQEVAVVEITQLKGEAEFIGKKRKGHTWDEQDEADAEDNMPDMSYCKESQAIPENADVITILHNPRRHENPFAEDGAYRYQTILCKVEQRDDVSGTVLKLKADLRTCCFSLWSD